MMKNALILVFLSFLLVFSCKKEELLISPTLFEANAYVKNGNTVLVIVKKGDKLVSGAKVTLGSNTATSNVDGVVEFKNVSLSSSGELLKVESSQCFTQYQRVFTGTKSIEIKMQYLYPYYKPFDSSKGSLPSDIFYFQPNSIVDANGNPFDGKVNIAVHTFRPDNMEGAPDFRAIDAKNTPVTLASFGMFCAELTDNQGNKLQLKPGTKAIVKVDIDPTLLANAPKTIPQWYFDEQKGYWIEEGEAILKGDFYEMAIPHFSYWNCDSPYELVHVKGKLTSEEGVGIPYVSVDITVKNGGVTRAGFCNAGGYFEGFVPKNETLIFKYQGCDGVVKTVEVPPINADKDLGNIGFPAQKIKSITLNAVDCQLNPIAEGYAIVDNSTIIPLGFNGKVAVPIPCDWIDKSIKISIFDSKKNLYGKIIVDGNNFAKTNNSKVLVCTDASELLEINYNGKTTKYNKVGYDGNIIYVVNDTILPNPQLPISFFFTMTYTTKNKDFGQSGGASPNNEIREVFFLQENMECDTSCHGKIDFTNLDYLTGVIDATFNFTYKGLPVTGKIKIRD